MAAAIAFVSVVGISTVVFAHNYRSPAQIIRPSTSPSASLLSQPSQPSSGLPACPSETATGCDKSKPRRADGSSACIGKGTALIGASPIDLSEISAIHPMGLMIGGHVTPIDHGYFYIKGATENPPRQAAVKAPLAGIVTSVSRYARSGPAGKYDDYAISIDATCTFRVRFSNMVGFASALAAKVGNLQPNQSVRPNYLVAEGELIGYTGLPTAYGIDVWVENDDSILAGFVNPDQYKAERWKLHMVDLFDYTKEPLKSQLLALDVREAMPRWGKIDHDIDGKLIGNWFLKGSGGYAGSKAEDYYKTHLAITYDGMDPTQIVVSLGNYQGQPKQFAVQGNKPDPAEIDQKTGLIKYELSQISYYLSDTGQIWNGLEGYKPHIRMRANQNVEGTILLQLTDKRQLKMEVFPNKLRSQVGDFDDKALTYER